ncbi:MAG: hypothetical protein WD534_13335 [Phycisphaeraceae bacterium]
MKRPARHTHLTPAQRRDAIADLLARAVVRLHRRSALHNVPTFPPEPEIRLDSSAEMPLSVSRNDTTVDHRR